MRKVLLVSMAIWGALMLSCSPEKMPEGSKINPNQNKEQGSSGQDGSDQQSTEDPTVKTIQLTSAGSLSKHVSDSEKYLIEKLKIIGFINGDDIRLLRDMAGNDFRGHFTEGILKYLDLSESQIVAGGDRYLDADTLHTKVSTVVSDNGFRYTLTESNEIPREAFSGCSLHTIILPKSLLSIGQDAFSGTELTSINIPKSVNEIVSNPFSDCSKLQSIYVETGNEYYDSRDNCYALIKTNTNHLIRGCQSTIIPNSIKTIGDQAFSYCVNLKTIVIPNSVISIGSGAFWHCENLGKITLPSSVENIGQQAFIECKKLESIELPSSQNTLQWETFRGCSELKTVSIPNSITKVGERAFRNCDKIVRVNCEIENVFPINENVFSSTVYSSAELHVPSESKSKYQTTEGWKNFVKIY